MTKKNLVSTIFILVCGVLILLPLFLPFIQYSFSQEFIQNGQKMTITESYGMFDADYVQRLSNHFRVYESRQWLMYCSDAVIILAVVCIVATAILALVEALSFAKFNPAKIKKWYGLIVFIFGCLLLIASFLFFVFSGNVYKDSATTTTGYTISSFTGHIGWYLVALASIIAGLTAFLRKIKKVEA